MAAVKGAVMTEQEREELGKALTVSCQALTAAFEQLHRLFNDHRGQEDRACREYAVRLERWMQPVRSHLQLFQSWRETVLRHTAVELAGIVPAQNLPFLTTDAEVFAHYGINLKEGRPKPAVVRIQADKRIRVYKEVSYYPLPSAADFKKLNQLKKLVHEMFPKGPSVPFSDSDGNAYRQYLSKMVQLKSECFPSTCRSVMYTMERAGFRASINVPGSASMDQLTSMLNQINSQIGHERAKAKNAHWSTFRSTGDNCLGKVRLDDGHYLERMMRGNINEVFKDKTPKTKTPHLGIEIEFVCKLGKKDVAKMLTEAKLEEFVTVVEDHSLRVSAREDFSHEVCILAPEASMMRVLERTCAVIRDAGGYVNKTCGLHVHLDMRARRPEVCFKRLLNSLDILYQVVPAERVFNKHCKRNPRDMQWAPKEFPKGNVTEERYYAINQHSYTRHDTIEVRMHSGTVNPIKIWRWIQLLLAVIDTPARKTPSNMEDFIQVYGIFDPLAGYLRERQQKFDKGREEFDDETKKRLVEDEQNSIERHVKNRRCQCSNCIEALRKQNAKMLMQAAKKNNLARKVA